MILCESTYDQKLNNQILKRAHRSDQKCIVIYKIFCNNTVIEKLIKSMRRNKSTFKKKKFFLKMQKENNKVLFKKIITEYSVSLLRQHYIVIFGQYYLFDI